MAVKEAISWTLSKEIHSYSDSQAVLKSLASFDSSCGLIQEIKELSGSEDGELVWFPLGKES